MGHLHRRPHPQHLALVYFRPSDPACAGIDDKLFDVVARYRDRVRLVVRHVDAARQWHGAWVSGRCPTIVFLVGDRLVAQMIGDLPRHELDQLVVRALASTRPA